MFYTYSALKIIRRTGTAHARLFALWHTMTTLVGTSPHPAERREQSVTRLARVPGEKPPPEAICCPPALSQTSRSARALRLAWGAGSE